MALRTEATMTAIACGSIAAPSTLSTATSQQLTLPRFAEAAGMTQEQWDVLPAAPQFLPPSSRVRQKDRAAQWQKEKAKALQYVTEHLGHAAVQEYERQIAAGPDFIKYRHGSDFREAPAINMDGNARVRLWTKFNAICRGTWSAKRAGKHRGEISRTAEAVFGALMYLAAKYGRVYPSMVGLAQLAQCCKQSVATALNDLEVLGFITRHRRVRKVMTPLGFRVEQITNAYEVHEPRMALGRLADLIFGEKPANIKESNFWPASQSTASDSRIKPRRVAGGYLASMFASPAEAQKRQGAAPDGAAKGLSR
jgi:hypothetical protein